MTIWEKLPLSTRLEMVHIDIMRHPQFALLSGVVCMGKSLVVDDVPTACTNGEDKLYGAEFIKDMTRKQLRYLVLHENRHAELGHCTLYNDLCRRYPHESNVAQDYVVNLLTEDMDPTFQFVERPTNIPPLVDPKYRGWSFPQVLRDLLQQQKGQGQGQGQGRPGGGDQCQGLGQTLDAHVLQDFPTKDAGDAFHRKVDDARMQGKAAADRLAGKNQGGFDLVPLAVQRDTDYLRALRDWMTSICVGDEYSRFCPPNKRLLAAGFIMPSHFAESTGELIVAADTSGSMDGVYPVMFGEIARLCAQVRPERVRVLWWDTAVCGEQLFSEADYDKLADVLKPAGGGGTSPHVVLDYIEQQRLTDVKGIVWLTDGYFFGSTPTTSIPSLWGVIDNERFTAPCGKVMHIDSTAVCRA